VGRGLVQGSSFLLPLQQGCQLPRHRHPGKRFVGNTQGCNTYRRVISFPSVPSLVDCKHTHSLSCRSFFGSFRTYLSAVATCVWDCDVPGVEALLGAGLRFREGTESRRRAETHDIIDYFFPAFAISEGDTVDMDENNRITITVCGDGGCGNATRELLNLRHGNR
jgi:hypothetical protein